MSAAQVEVAETYTEEFSCSPDGRQCPMGFTCVTSPYATALLTPGMSNVALTMLTIFQCMTMSSWSYVQYHSMDYAGWYVSACDRGTHTAHAHAPCHSSPSGCALRLPATWGG